MASSFRRRGPIAMSAAVMALVAVAAVIAIGLSHPEPVPSGALGPDWQCARLALVLTSCTRAIRVKASATPAKEGKGPTRPLAPT